MIVDYEKVLDQALTIRDVLPPDHLARFIVKVVSWLDLRAIYARYAPDIGIIKETLGFRQFSLRSVMAVTGE
jgi:hypothetical protein